MKKNNVLLLVLVFILTCTAGCGARTKEDTNIPSENETAAAEASEEEQPEPVVSSPEYTMTFAYTHNEGTFGSDMCVKMAELIEEKSEGRIKVELYPAGQLGDIVANLEGLRTGTVDICQCAATNISSWNNRWSVFSLPFMFSNYQEAQAAFQNETVRELLDNDLQEIGMKLLGVEDAGARSVINKIRPINEPGDCSGITIRCLQDVYIAKGFELCGFNPVAMGWTEVYSAIQQGTVDGADNSAVYLYDAQFQDLCKYVSLTEMVRQPGCIMMSHNAYSNLPKDLQAAIDEAGAEWETWQWQAYEEYEAEALENLKAAGCEVNTITEENHQKFVDITAPLYDEFFKEVPEAEELYDAMMAAVGR